MRRHHWTRALVVLAALGATLSALGQQADPVDAGKVEAASAKVAQGEDSRPAGQCRGGSLTRVEDWLESADGKVRGRPDRIEFGGDGTRVVDLKTRWERNSNG